MWVLVCTNYCLVCTNYCSPTLSSCEKRQCSELPHFAMKITLLGLHRAVWYLRYELLEGTCCFHILENDDTFLSLHGITSLEFISKIVCIKLKCVILVAINNLLAGLG